MSVDPNAFRLSCAVQGLKANKIGLMLTRGATNKAMMAIVSEFTGKKYGRNAVDEAIKDATDILDAYKEKIRQAQLQPK